MKITFWVTSQSLQSALPKYKSRALCDIREWVSLPCSTDNESVKKYHSPYFLKRAPLTVTCQHLRVRFLAQQQGMSHLPTHRMLKQNPWEVDLLTSWSGRLSNPTWPERDKFRSSSFWNFRRETFDNPWQCHLGTPPSPILSSWHAWKKATPLCPPRPWLLHNWSYQLQSYALSTKSHWGPKYTNPPPRQLRSGDRCTGPGEISF